MLCCVVWEVACSHGWSFPIGNEEQQARLAAEYKCDTCGSKHDELKKDYGHEHQSAYTREWFIHMPYAAPTEDLPLFEPVATSAQRHYDNLLFWEMLFSAYYKIVHRRPSAPLLAVHNFCGSAGTLRFMDRPAYTTYYQVGQW